MNFRLRFPFGINAEKKKKFFCENSRFILIKKLKKNKIIVRFTRATSSVGRATDS